MFQKTYGGPSLDWCNSVMQMPDSNFLMVCSTKNFGAGMEDMYLIKTNQLGDTLWTRTYGGSNNDDAGRNVIITSNGGFIINGITECFGAGSKDICLIKTDSTGDIAWAKTYGGTSVDICNGVLNCFDGGYMMSGTTYSFGAGMADIYLIKTDASGDTMWTRTYGSSAEDWGNAAIQTSDSGFIITGYTEVNGSQDVLLIKTDAAGTVSWAKTYGGPADDIGNDVIEMSDGFCIAGSTLSFGAGAMDGYLVKTDFTGDTLWSRTFGTNDSDAFISIKQTADAGLVMTGFANKKNNVYDDFFISKTDSMGQSIWNQVIGNNTTARDVGETVIQTLDGGYLVSGYSQSFGGGTDILLIKTDKNGFSGCNHKNTVVTSGLANTEIGTFIPQLSDGAILQSPIFIPGNASLNTNTLCLTTGIIHLTTHDPGNTSIIPNPFSSTGELIIKGRQKENTMLFILTDLLGSEVRKTKLVPLVNPDLNASGEESVYLIEKGNLAPGMYIYEIIETSPNFAVTNSVVGTGKLIIE